MTTGSYLPHNQSPGGSNGFRYLRLHGTYGTVSQTCIRCIGRHVKFTRDLMNIIDYVTVMMY